MQFIKSFCNFFKSLFRKNIIVIPQQGDIVEDSEGNRFLVFGSEEEDIIISKSIDRVPNVRGRSRNVMSLENMPWPSEGWILYRGDKLLYPQKNYKLSFIVWLSNKILKK